MDNYVSHVLLYFIFTITFQSSSGNKSDVHIHFYFPQFTEDEMKIHQNNELEMIDGTNQDYSDELLPFEDKNVGVVNVPKHQEYVFKTHGKKSNKRQDCSKVV